MSLVTEDIEAQGRRFRLTWLSAPIRPPRHLTTQASGICFVDGQVVLVSDGSGWGQPGGHPENGESIENAFAREFAEEACGRITTMAYLGSVRVEEQDGQTNFQARFWARAELQPFEANQETTVRSLVPPSDVAKMLGWKNVAIMHATLVAAFQEEAAKTGA